MNSKYIACFVLCWFFCISVRAQAPGRDGYIVRASGDTVRGKIDYAEGVANPGVIGFTDGGGNRSVFGPAGIVGFGVNGDDFRSYTVMLYPYSEDPGVVTRSEWRSGPYDTALFLRVVTTGRLNLYTYEDERGTPYFWLQTAGKTPEPLQIRNRVERRGVENFVITDKVYQYQLADRVAGCSLVAARPVRVAYEENALRKLIDTFNRCGKNVVVSGHRRLMRAHLLITGGYRAMKVTTQGNSDLEHTPWPTYYGPAGGLGVALQQERGSKRFAVVIDGLYTPVLLNSNQFHKNYYQRFYAKLAFDEVKADVQLRYGVPLGDWRPFFGLGFSNSFLFNNNSTQKLVDVGNNQTIVQPLLQTKSSLQSYRPGGFVVVGIGWKRWSLELRYEKTADLSAFPGVSIPVSGAYALIGFQL